MDGCASRRVPEALTSRSSEEDLTRVVVNLDRCEDSAYCVNIAPEVFELSYNEYAVVIT